MEEREGAFLAETDRAILFQPDGVEEEDEAVWLPKSQIEYDDIGYERGDSISIATPRWLTIAKELE